MYWPIFELAALAEGHKVKAEERIARRAGCFRSERVETTVTLQLRQLLLQAPTTPPIISPLLSR